VITSVIGRIERRDIERDRQLQIRDRILAVLSEPMTPAEIARRTGLGACAVSLAANHWTMYFQVMRAGKRIETVERHRHLRAQ
jgi:hypothetical protein